MTTKEFIKKLDGRNAALLRKMERCRSECEAYDLAKAEGLTDSVEVFRAEMKALNSAVGELSENDLCNVSVGASTTDIVSAVSTYVGAAASAAAAAV